MEVLALLRTLNYFPLIFSEVRRSFPSKHSPLMNFVKFVYGLICWMKYFITWRERLFSTKFREIDSVLERSQRSEIDIFHRTFTRELSEAQCLAE